MRKWVVVAVVLLVLLAGAVGFALANLNRWLERNREWVAAQASTALGREVRFQEVGVSLRSGVSARLGQLSVADDPAWSAEPFLQAREVRVALRLLPALFGRFEVRYVVVDEPQVTVIRTRQGLNVTTLGGAKAAPATKPPAPAGASGAPSGLSAALLVSSIEIADGRLRFVDRTASPPAEYVAERLDVEASDVSLTTPVTLKGAAAVMGAKQQNVEVAGTVGPVGGKEIPVDLTVTLDAVPPAALSGRITTKATVAQRPEGLPAVNGTATLAGVGVQPPGAPWAVSDLDSTIELKGDSAVIPTSRFRLAGIPVEAEGAVERFQPARVRFTTRVPELDLRKLGYGGEGVRAAEVMLGLEVKGTGELADAGPQARVGVRSPKGTVRDVAYETLEADAALAGQMVTLERLRVGALGGAYEGSGTVDLRDANRPRFDTRSTVRGMTMRELLTHGFPAAEGRFDGRLDANLTLAGAGRDIEAVKPTLRGQGRIDVHDGVLKDVNVAESVLGGVTGVAGLSMLVPPDVRSRYAEVFGTGETRFDELGGDVRIADQRLATDNFRMAARDYTVTGHGSVTFDGRVDFTSTLVTSERLTADIVKAAKEAQYLTNADKRIAVPFRFVGKMPGVKPVPDTEWVAKAVGRAAVGTGVGKLLDELGGGKKKGGKERPEKELLRKGLDGLLGR
jgi:AsmA protein